ncbi:MAG TPA: 50S ribosomal protein L15 [Candidatus Moranbacteria bacterium]|nr:50S ribosomal protein L15 [Candidatus Moranbacteria bacterium]
MQVNNLKLNNKRKKRKTIGRGGKKGTYCGKGNKGQKARSGAHVDPLFEGGRSTLIDHMKKNRGFKSRKEKKNIVQFSKIEKKFKDGETVSIDTLIQAGLIDRKNKKNGVKIIGGGKITKKLSFEKGILFSKSIEKSNSKISL